jgi:hypothetical protein
MSAFTPLATFERTCREVCLVPIADVGGSFDHLIGGGEQRRRNAKAQRPGHGRIGFDLGRP